MNKAIVPGSLFALMVFLAMGSALEAQSQQRFAFINSQRILAEAPGAQAAQREFERDMQRYRGEIERMEQELGTMQDDFERQRGTLSQDARERRQQEMQQKFIQYQQRVGELEETVQRRQAELVSPIMDEISNVIERIREEGNYALIFDASAGALITGDPALDLTDQVLNRLRANQGR